MQFHYHPVSTYSQKTLIALYEKQTPFEPVIVNIGDPAARAEFERFHPRGKIPLLVTPEGERVPESTIIIEYLEEHHPGGTRLIPTDPDAAREVRLWDRIADLYLNDAVVTLLFQKIGFRQFGTDQLEKAEKMLRLSYAELDARLATREWVCGEFSLADCATIPPLYYARTALPFDEYPHLGRYAAAADARPSYARIREVFIPMWRAMRGT